MTMRDLSKKTEAERGNHGVALWALPREDFDILVIPDEGEPFTETFNTVSYAHARSQALHKFGPGHRIPNKEARTT
jgi:hypothetical protein